MVARSHAFDAWSAIHHDTHSFMAENHGIVLPGSSAIQEHQVGMAQACRLDFHKNLSFLRPVNINLINHHGLIWSQRNRSL
jgi:hypothetical protein